MTSVQHHVVTQTHSTSNLDNHLDALLDDLQTSVSRPGTSMALSTQNGPLLNGSAFGGQINLPPGASGYREITTTVTRDTNGVPMTSREYQIEYLNPANSVTVLDDRSSSPAMDLLKSGDLAGHQVKSYKTEVYDYKFSKTTSDKKVSGYGGPRTSDDTKTLAIDSKSYHQNEPQLQDDSQFSRTENFRGETNVSKNLNELDILLKELNNAPPKDSSSKRVQTIEIERSPDRYTDSSSTLPKRSASATREMSYTERSQSRSARAQSPTISPGTPKAPARTINVQREYNTMESRSHTSRRDSPSARSRSTEMSPTLRRRTPSPSSGDFRPSNFNNYPTNPKDLTPTRTVTTKSYNYSSTGRGTPTPTTFDEPQPYRSPSPVSFPQKRSPSPARKSLNRSDSGRTVSYQVSPAMSENPTVITYKYSSHSREQSRYPGGGYDERDQEEPLTRPFPTSTPIPAGEQSPPKKLDELMASFQDSKSRSGGDYHQGSSEYRHHVEYSGESRERHGGDLQRSPSFERNLRPSNVKVSQTYSQQQQQNQEFQNQYQQREQYHHQYQQREQPGSYQKEYQRKEEHQTREHSIPVQQQQREQYQQHREEYQTREHSIPIQQQQREQYQQHREEYQTREHSIPIQQQRDQYQQQREQYQQSQYQQYHQNQGAYQREHREQYQQSQGQQYKQNQQYQYQQQQQFQQNSSQIPVNDSMSSSQAYRSTSSSRSVAGPPVYYPPGVELFTKKEEAMLMQEQSGGKGKSKGKSKSKYEQSGKDKDKGKKVAGVPVCLPVCCAMPCSIM